MYRSERVSSRGKNEKAPKKDAPLVQKFAHRGANFCAPMRKNLHQQREKNPGNDYFVAFSNNLATHSLSVILELKPYAFITARSFSRCAARSSAGMVTGS